MTKDERIKDLEAQVAALLARVTALEARPHPQPIVLPPASPPWNPFPNIWTSDETSKGNNLPRIVAVS